jgi:hypothetical protein
MNIRTQLIRTKLRRIGVWFRKRPVGDSSEYVNDLSTSIKDREFLGRSMATTSFSAIWNVPKYHIYDRHQSLPRFWFKTRVFRKLNLLPLTGKL